MSIKDICTKNVLYVEPDTTITEVAQLMAEHECGSIFVAGNKKLSGVITDRDIVLRCVAESKTPSDMTAEECQTPQILYCYENDDPEEVLRNMAKNQVSRLPVLNNQNDKSLVGIISLGDLSTACKDKELSGETLSKIKCSA